IQLSKRDVLDTLATAREGFSTDQWKTFLLRSIGLERAELEDRQVNALLLRMVPFVERNYNLVELGPRGTGKSHLFQQVSPYARLISGGKATVAQMFVNLSSGQRGLVCQYDVVCFDFLSECWNQLRKQSRVAALQGRVYFGGALSGRDTNAVNKTVSGLLKLLFPGETRPSDEDLEWAVRVAMEARRRVK
ncbi:MAG: BREX system Lon protease-like protein BrxL, partial [Pirellulales bacterium]